MKRIIYSILLATITVIPSLASYDGRIYSLDEGKNSFRDIGAHLIAGGLILLFIISFLYNLFTKLNKSNPKSAPIKVKHDSRKDAMEAMAGCCGFFWTGGVFLGGMIGKSLTGIIIGLLIGMAITYCFYNRDFKDDFK